MQNKLKKVLSVSMCAFITSTLPVGSLVLANGKTESQDAFSSAWEGGFSTNQDEYEIYPLVHSIEYSRTDGSVDAFEFGKTAAYIAEEDIDTWTVSYLEEILEDEKISAKETTELSKDGLNVLIGVKGSGGFVDTWFEGAGIEEGLFEKTDAYAMKVCEQNGVKIAAILGKDTDAAYYGLSTFKMMLSSFEENRLLSCVIEDYANGKIRGFIEGFYGEFNYESRESQMRMLRDVKGNLYVFASKTDPYHYGLDVYPEDELKEIEHLVKVGQETKVRYGWSFHMGKAYFFNGCSTNPEDTEGYAKYRANVDALKAKFEQLHKIGVRDFHILNDDYNSGSYADVVMTLNELNAWLKTLGGVNSLVYCPNNYSKNWASEAVVTGELNALQALDDDIYLYWTGDKVNAPVTAASVQWPYERSNHEIVTWLNYPCSEHDKSGIYLGSLEHYMSNADDVEHQAGLMSNPVNYPEANKVAYFQLISWIWNHDNFSANIDKVWEASFKYLQPEVYDSYLTIARNVSNCPSSGRYPEGFPESEYLAEALNTALADIQAGIAVENSSAAMEVLEEMEHILSAIKDFRANCKNEELIDELNSWLLSLEAIASSAKQAILSAQALQKEDLEGAWSALASANTQLAKWDDEEPREFPDMGKQALAGSKRIQPFAASLIEWCADELGPHLNPDPEAFEPKVITSFAKNSTLGNMIDGDTSTAAKWTTIQVAGDYVGLDLRAVTDIKQISILQGSSDTDHDIFWQCTLEVSENGTDWTEVNSYSGQRTIEETNLNLKGRYVRLRVTGFDNPSSPSKKDYWYNIREFSVNATEKADAHVYTNVKDHSLSSSAATLSVTLSGTQGLTLQPQEYVGIKLKALDNLKAINGVQDGLVAEYSVNGVDWSSDPISESTAARYARLRNQSEAAVTLGSQQVGVTLMQPKEVEVTSNITAIKDGKWSNLVDGSISSYVWTGVNQEAGQWILVDLNQVVPFNSLTLYMDENRPRLYHGDIMVSLDGENWTTAMTVDASNDITVIDGARRWAACKGDGSSIRYVKIAITDSAKEESTEQSAYLKLFELQVNGTTIKASKPSPFSGNPAGDYENMADNDLTTFFAPSDAMDGYLEYTLTDKTDSKVLTILQDPNQLSNATVKVQMSQNGEWAEIGKLSQSLDSFDLPAGHTRKVRLEWKADKAPVLYEIFLSGSQEGKSDVVESLLPCQGLEVPFGLPFENLALPETVTAVMMDGSRLNADVTWSKGSYDEKTAGLYTLNGTIAWPEGIIVDEDLAASISVRVKENSDVRRNLALNCAVTSSGSEVEGKWTADLAFDGDKTSEESRWSSPKMKVNGSTADTEQTAQWLIADLGKNCVIDEIVASYYLKVYPTDYQIYTSFSGKDDEWTLLGNFGIEASTTTTNPVDTITLETPVEARYVKFVFNKINWNAGGNALSVREIEVFGKEKQASKDAVSITQPKALSVKAGTAFKDLNLPEKVQVNGDGWTLMAAVEWSKDNYSSEAGSINLEGTITMPEGWTNTQNLKAQITVNFAADCDKTALEAEIKAAKAVDLTLVSSGKTAFTEALKAAEETAANVAATQEDVNKAAAALKAAREALGFYANVALNKTAAASGCEVEGKWTPDLAFDGDSTSEESRWSAPRMKTGTSADQVQTQQWLSVDLGDVYSIARIDSSFYKKVYATSYNIQISKDGENWTAVDGTFGLEASTTIVDPVDVITFETPVEARYVKFVYNSVNHNAGGISVSVRDIAIYGEKAPVIKEDVDTTNLESIINKVKDTDLTIYKDEHKADFEKALEEARNMADDPETQDKADELARRLNRCWLELRMIPKEELLISLK